ncbi:MAG TPA: hypothetical protein VD971_12230 [Phycisphaerales bacterium]|nr:hypothetical protein [Phycisphaerales bacterium]
MHPVRSPRAPRVLVPIGLALIMGACAKPLFHPDEPRSQYDRTDALRERRAPTYVYDDYGRRRPNIRGRLLGGE